MPRLYQEEPASLPWRILMGRGSWSCSSRADARAQALAKLEEAIGRSEQALTRQLIAIAALQRSGQDARHAHEMLRVYTYVRPKGITMIGPNCPGVLSPGKANVGIIPAEVLSEGRIGLVSRSGTLTYQIGFELAQMGLGNSTIVGIGGDPVVGSSFIDILGKFEADPETEVVVMVGEIGGDEEEKAARYIGAEMSKPVVAYIAGFTAPPGKTMGHAGAIISGSSGTAQAKKEALEAAGVKVGTTPTEVAELAAETAGARA